MIDHAAGDPDRAHRQRCGRRQCRLLPPLLLLLTVLAVAAELGPAAASTAAPPNSKKRWADEVQEAITGRKAGAPQQRQGEPGGPGAGPSHGEKSGPGGAKDDGQEVRAYGGFVSQEKSANR